MRALKWLAWTFAVALVGAGAWYGRLVPFAQQWPLYEALRTTAAIIFAVVGAWLAIIYPERLRLSFKTPGSVGKTSADSSTELFTPVVNSTYVLCIILAMGVIVPLLKVQLVGIVNLEFCRGASYGLLVVLTLWQLWTVLLTLDPADRIKTFMDREMQHKKNLDAVKGVRAR